MRDRAPAAVRVPTPGSAVQERDTDDAHTFPAFPAPQAPQAEASDRRACRAHVPDGHRHSGLCSERRPGEGQCAARQRSGFPTAGHRSGSVGHGCVQGCGTRPGRGLLLQRETTERAPADVGADRVLRRLHVPEATNSAGLQLSGQAARSPPRPTGGPGGLCSAGRASGGQAAISELSGTGGWTPVSSAARADSSGASSG